MIQQLMNSQKESQEQRLKKLSVWLLENPDHPDRLTVFRDKLKLEQELGKNKWIGISKK
ncbi:hypothetical protein KORDIASMS9_02703 [Kordia sp. SMS9]|uniref:hypothetical protein n=1 Tax=Kordia sp. SMS9 TaxID=2282170 RepID=UPI000E108146|nr:hypothetical protein [Kordia sp. SMS9]AXG70463.1 hypothetical protein KORDIASMS9_02703 [Kordia sp. SMS9]